MAYRDLVLADGASHYWRLNEPSGTTAADLGAAPAAGTISGGVTLNQPGALVDGDTAMTFNGTTGKIVTAASVALPLTCTVELWLKLNPATPLVELPMFSTRGLSTGSSVILYVSMPSGLLNYYSDQGFGGGSKSVKDGQWHHAVYVLTGGTTVTLYTDGVLDGSSASTRATPSSGPAAIAWDSPNAEFWDGAMDEVAIYPVALTPAQILAHAKAATASGARPISWGLYTTTFAA